MFSYLFNVQWSISQPRDQDSAWYKGLNAIATPKIETSIRTIILDQHLLTPLVYWPGYYACPTCRSFDLFGTFCQLLPRVCVWSISQEWLQGDRGVRVRAGSLSSPKAWSPWRSHWRRNVGALISITSKLTQKIVRHIGADSRLVTRQWVLDSLYS